MLAMHQSPQVSLDHSRGSWHTCPPEHAEDSNHISPGGLDKQAEAETESHDGKRLTSAHDLVENIEQTRGI